MGIKWERQMELCNLRDIPTDLISQKLCPQKKQTCNYIWRGRHTWTDVGEVCRCLLLHVEFKANLSERSVQFYYFLHCSFHFLTPLDCLFPGKIGNRRTKISIIRKDFLAIFAVLLKLGSNNNTKNLTSKANLVAIQFGRAQKGWLRISWGGYLKFWGLQSLPIIHFNTGNLHTALVPQQVG